MNTDSDLLGLALIEIERKTPQKIMSDILQRFPVQIETLLSANDNFFGRLAGGPGFEPGLAESESAVLPLNYPPPRASSREEPRLRRVGRIGERPVCSALGAQIGWLERGVNRNARPCDDRRGARPDGWAQPRCGVSANGDVTGLVPATVSGCAASELLCCPSFGASLLSSGPGDRSAHARSWVVHAWGTGRTGSSDRAGQSRAGIKFGELCPTREA